jgi:flagellar basal-body rod modification protein FlgD
MYAATQTPQAVSTKSAKSATTPSSSSTSASDAEATFLNMLVTELQNQDPTSPMDPTQMVGQMFSMNQLQQLIDINTTLDSLTGTSTSSK